MKNFIFCAVHFLLLQLGQASDDMALFKTKSCDFLILYPQ